MAMGYALSASRVCISRSAFQRQDDVLRSGPDNLPIAPYGYGIAGPLVLLEGVPYRE
jgi:hypothetical protein